MGEHGEQVEPTDEPDVVVDVLTVKIHLATDGRGLPMSVMLMPRYAGDGPQLLPVLDQVDGAAAGPGPRASG